MGRQVRAAHRDEDGAVGLVGVGGAGGAVRALAVRAGDVAVLADGTGTLVVVEAFFHAFGAELKPIL